MRIACHNLSPSEIDALRSLIGLVRPYLKQHWEIAPSREKEADLVIINRDVPGVEGVPREAMVVGCATRPRTFTGRTIHRPFRVPEILAVLSECGEQRKPTTADEQVVDAYQYRLIAWPLGFETLPRQWWKLMSSISRCPRTLQQILDCTRLPADEAGRCLDELRKRQLIDRLLDRHARPVEAAAPAARRPWSSFVARLSHVLGLAQ